ncbi:MAG: tetratricopeptide repeat protein, partial [Anaerolineae bacterium]
MSVFNHLFGKKDPQRQPLDPNQLLRAFEQFINARTWSKSQRIVEQSPVLLHPDADDILRQLAAAQPDQQTRQVVEEHSALLRRCQEVGIKQAFAGKTARPSPQPSPLQGEGAGMPPQLEQALRGIMAELAASGVELRSPQDLEAALASRPDLASRLETAAQALGMGGGPGVPSQFRNGLQQAREAEQSYLRTGNLSALDAAATARQRIVEDPAFVDGEPRFQLEAINDTGRVFLRRYQATGDIADLNRALDLWQTAVQRTPPNSPDLPSLLNNLGNGLRTRFARTGAPADLEEAIRIYQSTIQRTPPNSPYLPPLLNNLGNGLSARYARTGALADLDEAIRVYQSALQRTPPDSPDLPSLLNNLGNGLRDRYLRTGVLADLEEAIASYKTALQRTPPDSPDLPSRLNNLGNGLSDRYARTGALADLEEAIESYESAVQRTPPGSPDLPYRLSNLGGSLSDRYLHTGTPANLDKAIASFKAAERRTPPDSPNLPSLLNNLGTGLSHRYARTGALADLDEAIAYFETAVQRTPPDLPGYLNNLGNSLRARFARTGNLADLAEAQVAYQRACECGQLAQPEFAVVGSRSWGNWALQRRAWSEAAEAYAFGRRAIDRLFATQTSRAAKESWLREAQGLPANAAYALAQLGKLEEAVVALEAGRARLLAEALEQNRRDLEQLAPLGHGDLLARYRAAVQRLAALQQQASQPTHQSPNQPVTQFDHTTWRQQLEQAQVELDAAIAAIRQVPGYQDFFLPPTFEKIQRAATPDAPLVYLAATPVGSVALVVHAASQKSNFSEKLDFSPALSPVLPPPVSVVWLDSFSEADLDALLVERQGGEVTGGYLPGQLGDYDALHASLAQLLPRLGQALMGPLAAHLAPSPSEGEGGGEGDDSPPSVVLIPAGRLSLLPLHAASYPVDGHERCFLDQFAVRYAPSAASLAAAQGEAQRRRAPLHLAGVGNPLPDLATGAWASQRARAIMSRLPAAPANEALH